jgi:hypothetical protein
LIESSGRLRTASRRSVDHYRIESDLLDGGDEFFRTRQLRIKRHVETIVFKINLDVLYTSKPIQGFFDRVGSTHSCDARGFDKPRNAQGHCFELCRRSIGARGQAEQHEYWDR